MEVCLKLYGVFRSAAGSDTVSLQLLDTEPTVRSAIIKLVSRPDCGELKKLILDGKSLDPRPNTMILVSGREIGALAGLETRLKKGDELSLLPVAHGG